MSVINPTIDFIDGVARRIYLKEGVGDFYPIDDIYREYRNLRRADENLRKFEPLLRAEGNVPKGGGAFTPRYVVLINGTKIIPFNESLQLNQLGDMITDNPDIDSTLYDISGLTLPKPIFIKPSEAEIIQLNSVQIEYASYNGGVTLDAVNGTDSSAYPYGTPLHPCKTTANSDAIRLARGFKKIYLRSNLTLTAIADGVLTGLDIICEVGNRNHTLTIDNVLVTDCKTTNLTVTGTFKEGSTVQAIDCEIYDVTNVGLRAEKCKILHGHYENTELTNCTLEGDIDIQEGGVMSGTGIVFEGDFSTIDMQSLPSTVSLDIESGYVKIINTVIGCLAEFNLRGGELELDPTCIAGEFYVEGYGTLYNDSTMTIKGDNLISPSLITDGSSNPLTAESIREEIDSNSVKLGELYKVAGLDETTPATTTRFRLTAGDINIDITGDGETTTTFTRND